MAAISKIIRVTSCSASHTSCMNVFGFFGGMKFFPKISFLFSRSAAVPANPVNKNKQKVIKIAEKYTVTAYICLFVYYRIN